MAADPRRSKTRDIATRSKKVLRLDMSEKLFPLKLVSPKHLKKSGPATADFSSISGFGELAGHIMRELTVFTQEQEALSITAIRSALAHLASKADGNAESWSALEWQSHVADWFVALKTRPSKVSGRRLNDTTINGYLWAFSSFARRLQDKYIIPEFDFPQPLPHKPRKPKTPIGHSPADRTGRPLDVMPEKYRAANDAILEIEAAPPSAQKAAKLNKKLIEILTEYAVEECRRIVLDFENHNEARADNGWVDAFLDKYMITREPLRFRRNWQKTLGSIQRAVVLYEALYPAQPISHRERHPIIVYIGRRTHVLTARALMHGTPLSLVPFIALLLILLKNEVSSNKRMTAEAATKIDDKLSSIEWLKKRAHSIKFKIWKTGSYQSMFPGSRQKITPSQIVAFLEKYRSALVPFAKKAHRNDLFLCWSLNDSLGDIMVVSDGTINHAFHRWRRAHPILCRYHFTLDKIRNSIGKQLYIESGGNIFVVQNELNQKDISVTQRYVSGPLAEYLEVQHAREVHDEIAYKSVSNAEILKRIGLNEQAVHRSLEKANQGGFLGQPQEDGSSEETRLSAFATFLLSSKHLIVESAAVAAEVYAFRQHILDEAYNLRHEPEWEEVWAPMLIFLHIAWEATPANVQQAGIAIAGKLTIRYGAL